MQLVRRKMKPVLTVGSNVTFKPSADIKDSFCVSSPKLKPTSKLNEGPAKQAAILRIVAMKKCTSDFLSKRNKI